MTKIKPFINCFDYWPEQIPPEKLKIYNQLIAEGQITKPQVIRSRLADGRAAAEGPALGCSGLRLTVSSYPEINFTLGE